VKVNENDWFSSATIAPRLDGVRILKRETVQMMPKTQQEWQEPTMAVPWNPQWQGLVNVPIFHITQLLGIYHHQQILESDVQNPQNRTFTNP
jgi:hypothetical protein